MQTNKQTILCKLHQNTNKTGKCIQTFYEAHLILIPKQESRIKENVRSMYIISMDAKKFESLSVSKDILLWWVMLSIFSCICWPSACLLWKNVYSGPPPNFFFKVISKPNVWLELMTLRSRVLCSTNWPSQVLPFPFF